MQYFISNLWKLPTISGAKDEQDHDSSAQDSQSLMAAACRDCNQYNFPPKAQCRYCGSPRVHTVQVQGKRRANPGTFIFGAADATDSWKSGTGKPN